MGKTFLIIKIHVAHRLSIKIIFGIVRFLFTANQVKVLFQVFFGSSPVYKRLLSFFLKPINLQMA